jgi:hypothetical protein
MGNLPKPKPKDNQVFLRLDLDRTTTPGVIWYRLNKDMKDFLNLCRGKYGEMEAVIFTKEDDDESGDYHWNIGFIFPIDEKELSAKKTKK